MNLRTRQSHALSGDIGKVAVAMMQRDLAGGREGTLSPSLAAVQVSVWAAVLAWCPPLHLVIVRGTCLLLAAAVYKYGLEHCYLLLEFLCLLENSIFDAFNKLFAQHKRISFSCLPIRMLMNIY